MAFSSIIIVVLLLCLLASGSIGPQADCDVYAATGSNFTVQLKHVLKDSESLRWFKDKNIIFNRRSKYVIRGKNDDVDSTGSLKLTQLTKDKSGQYTPEVHREDGTSAGHLPSVRLCVLDPVQKPKVTVTCDKTKVTFTCDAGQDEKIEWFMDGETVAEKEKTLTRPAEDVLNARFSCNVSNPVSSEISQPVQQDCIKPCKYSSQCQWVVEKTDHCAKTDHSGIWIAVGICICLVVILVVVICCVQSRRKKQEKELRLQITQEQQQL